MKKTGILVWALVLTIFGFAYNIEAQITDSIPSFKDCDDCPEMVIIPAGSVFIGSYDVEIGRRKGERQRIEATIDQPFAIGQYEITKGQFRQFIKETNHIGKIPVYKGQVLLGCNYFDGKNYGYIAEHNWETPGYPQQEDAPVVCVSWSDAVAYCEWLSNKTGRRYYIPSTVQWEYASRAGSNAPWFWGTSEEDACEYANVGDRTLANFYLSRPTFPCDDGSLYTSRIGRYQPNDIVGNAWEWTNDCYHKDLSNAPVDGTSWEDQDGGDCTFRTPKGGSWISGISWSRAAVRSLDGADYRSFMLGFRIAAEIEK